MKIAMTVWNERIAPVYDSAGKCCLYELGDTGLLKVGEFDLPAGNFHDRRLVLKQKGVNALICGAITNQVEEALVSAGIEVFSFIAGGVEEIEECFLKGKIKLANKMMPGCRCIRHRCLRQRRKGRTRQGNT